MIEEKNQLLTLTVPAIRFRQMESSDRAMYIAVIKVVDLVKSNLFKIDFYRRTTDSKDSGYQRPLSDSQIKAVRNYLLHEIDNPHMPTAMILNCRERLNFEEVFSGSNTGLLTIDNQCFLLDGQHRHGAWKLIATNESEFRRFLNYEVPIVILSNFDFIKEIEQFYVINSRQKKIETDLAQRHLLQLSNSESTRRLIPPHLWWQVPATQIVDILNEEEGVWKNKIILPSDDKELRRWKIIKQSAFVDSLKPLFVGREGRLFDPRSIDNQKIKRIADLLKLFWSTIQEFYPKAVRESRDYLVMRGVGVHAMHLWLASLRIDMRPTKTEERKNKIRKEIEVLHQSHFSLEFWAKNVAEDRKKKSEYAGAFSSTAGYQLLADMMKLGKLIYHR